ncbi:MAG: iron-containing redox enzyme family protein [Methylobacter sp.]|nr:iron-containing redox enzyme family protein [Methylobacter sp.]
MKTTDNIEFPRLRHCTLITRNDTTGIHMIVGRENFILGKEIGSLEKFLEVKRYFDGRHSISTISKLTGITCSDLTEIVNSFSNLGLMREEKQISDISASEFVSQVNESCEMWRRQIGYHQLFGKLERKEVRKEVFLGLILETYHYVASAPRHISTAISHCHDKKLNSILTEYFLEEHDHALLFINALEQMGIPKSQIINAHPIIGTISLTNMLCEIARQSPLAYIACTSLIEARATAFVEASESIVRIATQFGYSPSALDPILAHMQGDIEAGHSNMLENALISHPFINANDAHFSVNCLHDLKHSFDQFHDDILRYYSDVSNYIPRLSVDYFSL